jgi:hypothetical protein
VLTSRARCDSLGPLSLRNIARSVGLLSLFAWTHPHRLLAASDEPAQEIRKEFLANFAPPAVDAPGLRLPEPMTRLYLDAAYERSSDLSALPFVEGSGRNIRFALGGSWRRRRLALEVELPSSQITTLNVTRVPTVDGSGMPIPQDQHQTATSIGDLRMGATWTKPLPVARLYMVAGFGLRLRVPTHTTVFQFHLIDGSVGQDRFPYYFHIEPTLILGGAIGRLAFVVNEGLLAMTGPDGNFDGVHIVVPNLLFWSAHYALVYAPLRILGFSVDLATDVQINQVDAVDFMKLNGVVAASLAGGVQLHLGPYRIDLVGRLALTRDAQLFGVLEFAGAQSVTLRLTRTFN